MIPGIKYCQKRVFTAGELEMPVTAEGTEIRDGKNVFYVLALVSLAREVPSVSPASRQRWTCCWGGRQQLLLSSGRYETVMATFLTVRRAGGCRSQELASGGRTEAGGAAAHLQVVGAGPGRGRGRGGGTCGGQGLVGPGGERGSSLSWASREEQETVLRSVELHCLFSAWGINYSLSEHDLTVPGETGCMVKFSYIFTKMKRWCFNSRGKLDFYLAIKPDGSIA